jgi:hypothetical protein
MYVVDGWTARAVAQPEAHIIESTIVKDKIDAQLRHCLLKQIIKHLQFNLLLQK